MNKGNEFDYMGFMQALQGTAQDLIAKDSNTDYNATPLMEALAKVFVESYKQDKLDYSEACKVRKNLDNVLAREFNIQLQNGPDAYMQDVQDLMVQADVSQEFRVFAGLLDLIIFELMTITSEVA
tara:strand:- start:803 stop:1177 length:375 start_codon:yes stop_codon:yes gene_type:complete